MGAFTAVVLGVFDFTGGKLTGWTRETDEDRFERKEYLRKNRRRSGEETIAQLGDGRAGSKFPWQCRERGERPMNVRWYANPADSDPLAQLRRAACRAPEGEIRLRDQDGIC